MATQVQFSTRLKEGDKVVKPDPKFVRFLEREYWRGLDATTPKILVATLTLTDVGQAAYQTHLTCMYNSGGHMGKFRVAMMSLHRMAIDAARNHAVRTAIKGGFDYLFFYDDDTLLPAGVVRKLLHRMKEFNAVSGGYFVRGYPFNPMVFRWIGDGKMRIADWRTYKRHIDGDNVMRDKVAAVGCGCTMFRVEDFTKVPFPWFLTGLNHSEDVFWFVRAHKLIPGYKVGMDFNVSCGHVLDPLYVDKDNVDELRRVYRRIGKHEL